MLLRLQLILSVTLCKKIFLLKSLNILERMLSCKRELDKIKENVFCAGQNIYMVA